MSEIKVGDMVEVIRNNVRAHHPSKHGRLLEKGDQIIVSWIDKNKSLIYYQLINHSNHHQNFIPIDDVKKVENKPTEATSDQQPELQSKQIFDKAFFDKAFNDGAVAGAIGSVIVVSIAWASILFLTQNDKQPPKPPIQRLSVDAVPSYVSNLQDGEFAWLDDKYCDTNGWCILCLGADRRLWLNMMAQTSPKKTKKKLYYHDHKLTLYIEKSDLELLTKINGMDSLTTYLYMPIQETVIVDNIDDVINLELARIGK